MVKIVSVEWIDSCSIDGWLKPGDVPVTPKPIHSIGYVIEETSKYITISHSVDITDGIVAQYCGFITIPKVSIIKRRVI